MISCHGAQRNIVSRLHQWVPSLILLCVAPSANAAAQADWPQWGGPQRDFKAESKGLADIWPETGLRRLWTRPLGDGYSSVAVADGVLYTMYRKEDHEHVTALQADTGKTAWEHRYPAPLLPNTDLSPGPGPHATPLVVNGHVCAAGVTGRLHCLDAATGKVLWHHHLTKKFNGTVLYRGYSSSPIAYRDSVIVTVGGAGHAVVAFRLEDGTVKWQKQDFEISHASPLLINFKEQDQLVVFASEVLAGLDPRDGELIWQHPQPMSGGYIASLPVWGEDGRLFFSTAYGGGSRCIQLSREGDRTVPREIWHNNRMRLHHSNVIRVGDYLYGSSGDFGPKLFAAIDVKTGQIVWQDRSLTRCSSIYADGKFLILEEDGHLALASVSPEGLKVHSKVELFPAQAWTVPTVVGKKLYVRNREVIMAFELP